MPLRIMLVDDHSLFRNGLKTLLNIEDEFDVIGEACDGEDFLAQLDLFSPDVVLMDIAMPKMSGIEAAAEALRRDPALKIITLSMYGEEDYYFKMVSIGVKGFLLKNSDIDEVKEAVRSVAGGGSYFSKELLFNLVSNLKSSSDKQPDESAELSEREQEILLRICKGMSNQEIGDELYISKRTVDKHRANILLKTNCKNTANLVVYAIKKRLVEI